MSDAWISQHIGMGAWVAAAAAAAAAADADAAHFRFEIKMWFGLPKEKTTWCAQQFRSDDRGRLR